MVVLARERLQGHEWPPFTLLLPSLGDLFTWKTGQKLEGALLGNRQD